MKIPIYTIAPMWWTPEIWKMSEKERESLGIKLIYINYDIKY